MTVCIYVYGFSKSPPATGCMRMRKNGWKLENYRGLFRSFVFVALDVFDVLAYNDKNIAVPFTWIGSDPKLIVNPQMVKLYSFDTKEQPTAKKMPKINSSVADSSCWSSSRTFGSSKIWGRSIFVLK
ncbi:hypothetical protein SADUNF_Sadunf14G0090600 [Salix dunnii]|uniref:Uncharacterized protein n=1 Tax=Salix dunnii TaxID=1413687 RepID=A0A835JIH4_9ROSI|nr:hypothetical protein SADUNF_Sadunf14G0090600 [Salix dunnii]